MNKKDIEQMIGGYCYRVKRIERSQCLQGEHPIKVVLESRIMNIGNLRALEGRGFQFLGCEITDDGYLGLTFDIKLSKRLGEIEH